MFDLMPIIQCPYCKTVLDDLHCVNCGRKYFERKDMTYIYDENEEHWQTCMAQKDALFRLEYTDNYKPTHDSIGYPYTGLEHAVLSQQANAAMFNVALSLMKEQLKNNHGYAVDVGAYNGWASMQLALRMKTVALDISDHVNLGMGSVPTNVGCGIKKVIADMCISPFRDNSLDIVFMCSAWHHLHDRFGGLNESYRVLKPGGVLVAMGECPQPEELIESFMNDGIRDYEGPPYTLKQLEDMLNESDFDQIELVPIKYSDGMEYKPVSEVIGRPATNNIIYGVKT